MRAYIVDMCAVVARFAAHQPTPNIPQTTDSRGAALLLATLEQHATNQDIASVGLDVLFALGYDAARGPNLQSLPILLQKGAPAFIFRMLELYPRSPEIYGPGLKAAACLLTAPEAGRRSHGMTGEAWCRVVGEVRKGGHGEEGGTNPKRNCIMQAY